MTDKAAYAVAPVLTRGEILKLYSTTLKLLEIWAATGRAEPKEYNDVIRQFYTFGKGSPFVYKEVASGTPDRYVQEMAQILFRVVFRANSGDVVNYVVLPAKRESRTFQQSTTQQSLENVPPVRKGRKPPGGLTTQWLFFNVETLQETLQGLLVTLREFNLTDAERADLGNEMNSVLSETLTLFSNFSVQSASSPETWFTRTPPPTAPGSKTTLVALPDDSDTLIQKNSGIYLATWILRFKDGGDSSNEYDTIPHFEDVVLEPNEIILQKLQARVSQLNNQIQNFSPPLTERQKNQITEAKTKQKRIKTLQTPRTARAYIARAYIIEVRKGPTPAPRMPGPATVEPALQAEPDAGPESEVSQFADDDEDAAEEEEAEDDEFKSVEEEEEQDDEFESAEEGDELELELELAEQTEAEDQLESVPSLVPSPVPRLEPDVQPQVTPDLLITGAEPSIFEYEPHVEWAGTLYPSDLTWDERVVTDYDETPILPTHRWREVGDIMTPSPLVLDATLAKDHLLVWYQGRIPAAAAYYVDQHPVNHKRRHQYKIKFLSQYLKGAPYRAATATGGDLDDRTHEDEHARYQWSLYIYRYYPTVSEYLLYSRRCLQRYILPHQVLTDHIVIPTTTLRQPRQTGGASLPTWDAPTSLTYYHETQTYPTWMYVTDSTPLRWSDVQTSGMHVARTYLQRHPYSTLSRERDVGGGGSVQGGRAALRLVQDLDTGAYRLDGVEILNKDYLENGVADLTVIELQRQVRPVQNPELILTLLSLRALEKARLQVHGERSRNDSMAMQLKVRTAEVLKRVQGRQDEVDGEDVPATDALWQSMRRLLRPHLSPYYQPYVRWWETYSTAAEEWLTMLPPQIVYNAMQHYAQYELSPAHVVNRSYSDDERRMLWHYVTWWSRYHPTSPYLLEFFNQGIPLLQAVYQAHDVHYVAVDQHTLQTFDPTAPLEWDTVQWRDSNMVRHHPLVQELYSLWRQRKRDPAITFTIEAQRVLREYTRTVSPAGGRVLHSLQGSVAQLFKELRCQAEARAEEMVDHPASRMATLAVLRAAAREFPSTLMSANEPRVTWYQHLLSRTRTGPDPGVIMTTMSDEVPLLVDIAGGLRQTVDEWIGYLQVLLQPAERLQVECAAVMEGAVDTLSLQRFIEQEILFMGDTRDTSDVDGVWVGRPRANTSIPTVVSATRILLDRIDTVLHIPPAERDLDEMVADEIPRGDLFFPTHGIR